MHLKCSGDSLVCRYTLARPAKWTYQPIGAMAASAFSDYQGGRWYVASAKIKRSEQVWTVSGKSSELFMRGDQRQILVFTLLLAISGARNGSLAQPAADFPESMTISSLCDVIAKRTGVSVLVDEQAGQQKVSLKLSSTVSNEALLDLLNATMRLKGFALVDTAAPNVKRMIKLEGLAAHARAAGGLAEDSTAVVAQVFGLTNADSSKLENILKSFVTQPGGLVSALPEQRMLLVTDFAPSVERVGEIIRLLDRPKPESEVALLKLTHAEPQTLAQQLNQILAAKYGASAGASLTAIHVAADPRTGQLILIGAPERVAATKTLVASLDVPQSLVTKTYTFRAVSPERVDRLVAQLATSSGDRRTYQSAVDKESGVLVATTTAELHQRIETLQSQLDVEKTGAASPIRFYKLSNAVADDVLATIRSMGESSVSAKGAVYSGPATQPASPTPTGDGILPMVRLSDATITSDRNTNTIIVVADPGSQQTYEQLIKMLDKRRPQVLIECTIVSLNTSDGFTFGVEVSAFGGAGGTDFLSFTQFGLSRVNLDTGELELRPGTGFNGTVLNASVAQVVIQALKSNSRARVVAAPRILVNDNAKGELASVNKVPFTSVNAGDTIATTTLGGQAEAGTKITVTPHISEGDHLSLEYVVSLSSFTGSPANPNVPPPSQENRVESQVTIPDGSTIVVGGLNSTNVTNAVDKVPLLGDVPGLGALFQRKRDSTDNNTLFVFIRPVILRDDQFADLKYISGEEIKRSSLPGDYPSSDPVLMQ